MFCGQKGKNDNTFFPQAQIGWKLVDRSTNQQKFKKGK